MSTVVSARFWKNIFWKKIFLDFEEILYGFWTDFCRISVVAQYIRWILVENDGFWLKIKHFQQNGGIFSILEG